jgi:hypothetical protein
MSNIRPSPDVGLTPDEVTSDVESVLGVSSDGGLEPLDGVSETTSAADFDMTTKLELGKSEKALVMNVEDTKDRQFLAQFFDPQRRFLFVGARFTQENLQKLLPGKWVGDDAIDRYGQCLQSISTRVWIPSVYFVSTLISGENPARIYRWTKKAKVQLHTLDRVIVPVNCKDKTHWCVVLSTT